MIWRSPGRPLTDAEASEFIRQMDNFVLASRLWADERVAHGILAYPLDPRSDIAATMLDMIARIRRHRRLGHDTAVLVLEWQRLARRGNEIILRPYVEAGQQWRSGKANGRATRTANRDEKVAKWQQCYDRLRTGGLKPKQARGQVVDESKGTPLQVSESWCRDNLREK